MCTLTNWRQILLPPPPEKFGATPVEFWSVSQPNLDRASWKSDGGVAEGSNVDVWMSCLKVIG